MQELHVLVLTKRHVGSGNEISTTTRPQLMQHPQMLHEKFDHSQI